MAKKTVVTDGNADRAAKAEKPIPREVIKSPNSFSVYVNDVQVMSTCWDLKLSLGQILELAPPSGESRSVKIEHLGEVRISPQLAKRLAVILDGQVRAYEENFGPIPTTPLRD